MSSSKFFNREINFLKPLLLCISFQIIYGLSFNVSNLSEAADNPFNICVRLIKISILYLFPVVSAGFFVCLSWRRYSFRTRTPH